MNSDGTLDINAFDNIVNQQIANGTSGLIPCGTTGEAATLSMSEHLEIIKLCVTVSAGRCPVIAGTGSNNTAEAIELTIAAQNFGAEAALIITPYYNKPTPEGIIAHFTAIHNATNIPLFLYDVPSRTALALNNSTILELAKLPRIIGIKDATGDMGRIARLRYMGLRDDFIFLSGDDASTLSFYAMGAAGSISVTANLYPKLCSNIYQLTIQNQWEQAKRLQNTLMNMHDALFAETSPAPVKYLASKMGLCKNKLRLPLTPVRTETEQLLTKAAIGVEE